jgi:hypothetical protein
MTAIDPGFPFISEITDMGSVRELIPSIIQAGLLTPGSFASRAFPSGVLSDSGILRNLSPVTAAGPSSIHTKFPFQPAGHSLLSSKGKTQRKACQVPEFMTYSIPAII